MVRNNDSQCYFVQLQIDSYLDGDLGAQQREDFQTHVHQCPACAQEFKYAQTLHDFILDLPQVDCDDQVLEPIHRLGGGARQISPQHPTIWQGLKDWANSIPAFPRYAVPALILVVFITPVIDRLSAPQPAAPMLAEQASVSATLEPEFTPEEVRQALMDLNVAMKYLNGMGLRTEVMIGDRFLISPIQDSINASLDVMNDRIDNPLDNDSI